MALDFLNNLTLSQGAGLASIGFGIGNSLFGGRGERRQAQELFDRQQALARALTPGTPEYNASVATEEQEIRRRNLEAIRNAMVANRRAVARTGMGLFFNPERQDETVAKAIMRSDEEGRARAAQQSRQNILGAMQGTSAAGQALESQMALGARRRQGVGNALQMALAGAELFDRPKSVGSSVFKSMVPRESERDFSFGLNRSLFT